MFRKYIPVILMLISGAVTCVISMIRQYPMLHQLLSLFVVMVIFYLLGNVIRWTIDYFERENEKRAGEQGEVFAKLGEDDDF